MGKKRERKEPVVPSQDKRICGGICLCQFTIVTSCVALVYLAVAVYMPSYKAFTFGMEPVPVMCQTVNTTMANSCDWASCGEWCLTKTSGFCPQIHVRARRNGSGFSLGNCTQIGSVGCPMCVIGRDSTNHNTRRYSRQPTTIRVKKYNCNNNSECATLTGVFNCSKGHCSNFSEVFNCRSKADGIIVDSEKDNLKLNGFFSCNHSRCTKYQRGPICDRICPNITTGGMNAFVQSGDTVVWARCERGLVLDEARGPDPGLRLPEPKEVWSEESGGILIVSCHRVTTHNSSISGTDCVNGTLLKDLGKLPTPDANFTSFWKAVEASRSLQVDPGNRYLPHEASLTIYNDSRLYINLEGCVNTLRGECLEFVRTHGRDGDNTTAQSRFPCFYHKNNSFMVVARFDLNKTWKELMIAIFIPSSLFVVSFVSLVVIGHSVRVGDDAKMRCVLCPKKPKPKTKEEMNAEMDLVMDGIIEQTNAIAESSTST